MEGEVSQRRVASNGIWMEVAEQGPEGGPVVLLLHGFPELGLSWRHQMSALARRGYRAVAPDMRGYGGTDAPLDPFAYTIFHLVGDLIGLLDQLRQQRVFVVGHDWGATVAWHLALFRPDRVRALLILGVPFFPRSPSIKPSDVFRNFGDGLYINQFQEPGRAEKAFARYDVSTIIKKFLSIKIPDLIAPPGMEIIDFLETPSSLPSWITEEEVQYFASKFEKSGFTGPLNYYRMMDMNWYLLAPWQGGQVSVQTKFIVGDKDLGFHSFTKEYITGGAFQGCVPKLEVVVIDGHHYIQQEKAERVATEIISFFDNHLVKESA